MFTFNKQSTRSLLKSRVGQGIVGTKTSGLWFGKVPGHQRKMCSHKDSVPSLVPEYKVETLYSGTGTVPEFWRGYQEKRCVHIGARRRIEPGHQV